MSVDLIVVDLMISLLMESSPHNLLLLKFSVLSMTIIGERS